MSIELPIKQTIEIEGQLTIGHKHDIKNRKSKDNSISKLKGKLTLEIERTINIRNFGKIDRRGASGGTAGAEE